LSDGAYQPPAGGRYVSSVAVAADGSATLNWRDGTRMQFNPAGRPGALDDANGNRTGDGYVVGPDNQLTSDGTYRYQYDAEGNLTDWWTA
jgi:hypothetical protein